MDCTDVTFAFLAQNLKVTPQSLQHAEKTAPSATIPGITQIGAFHLAQAVIPSLSTLQPSDVPLTAIGLNYRPGDMFFTQRKLNTQDLWPVYYSPTDQDFIGRLLAYCQQNTITSLTAQCISELDQYFSMFISMFSQTIKAMRTSLEQQQQELQKQQQQQSLSNQTAKITLQDIEHRQIILLSLEQLLSRSAKLVLSMTTERKNNTVLLTNTNITSNGTNSQPQSLGQFYTLNTNLERQTYGRSRRNHQYNRDDNNNILYDEEYKNTPNEDLLSDLQQSGITEELLQEDKQDIMQGNEQEELALVTNLEQTIQHISGLMDTLQTHISAQAQVIDRIQQDVEKTYDNIVVGNEQLVEAIASESCGPWFYASIFISMSCVVLAFDWVW